MNMSTNTTVATTNTTELEAVKNFVLPAMIENDFSAEDLGDDFAGLRMSFQRIKIPAGGTTQFEITGDNPEEPEYTKTFRGIIIYNHQANAYWPVGSEYDESAAPYCSSMDGIMGYGTPGGACANCEMNKYESDENGGKGKACKNMRHLYILRSGETLPVLLYLPPTSLKPFSEFANAAFVSRRRPMWASIVEFGIKRVENGTNQYGVATFRRIADFTQEEIPSIRNYVESFRKQISDTLEQRTAEANGRDVGSVDHTPRYATEENGEHYAVHQTPVINGDAALPQ